MWVFEEWDDVEVRGSRPYHPLLITPAPAQERGTERKGKAEIRGPMARVEDFNALIPLRVPGWL